MPRIFTTPAGVQTAKAFLHDLLLIGDARTTNQRGITLSVSPGIKASAKSVCDELVNRDFSDVNKDIRQLQYLRFRTPVNPNEPGKYTRLNEEKIAKCVVYAAELFNLYWDDTVKTPYEIDEFKKTLLGEAVFKYGRVISAVQGSRRNTASKASNTSGTASGTTPSQATQPKNNYKQSGPQSGNVRDLRSLCGGQGTPGQKVMASGSLIYKIVGDNPQSKNIPQVFIKPLSPSGAAGSTNKIFISSGNGYTDCTCYFDDPNDAQKFLSEIIKNNRVPNNVSNLRVVKLKADQNGYFLVGTEFGLVAVSAKTLNEALTEQIAAEAEPNSWEKATEGYSKKELEELHTWMRRD